MDINHLTFLGNYLKILKHISDSHFVAIDLELSGVSVKTKNRRKQTLQERYVETKAAAEQYQILQVGLTCVEQVQDLGLDTYKYVVRPYNIQISPLIDERLDLERTFAFSSSAVEFLLSHSFDMAKPFYSGVQYLSRTEDDLAMKLAMDRLDRVQLDDIQLSPSDVDSIAFLDAIRSIVGAFVKSDDRVPYIDILSHDSFAKKQPEFGELGQFEKRLVHQLVRAEFPGYMTLGRRSSVRVQRIDDSREASIRKSKKREIRDKIGRQTGFRWVMEALAADGNLQKLDGRLQHFAKNPVTGESGVVDIHDLNSRFHDAHQRLKKRTPVLVGHNCFTDMVYLYQCFFGSLPDTVEEFQDALHAVFPCIVDTKYLATHDCGDINPISSLQETEEKLRLQAYPTLETDELFGKYSNADHGALLHEAGYDSYLTALIMVRLSTRLDVQASADNTTKEPEISDQTTDPKQPDVELFAVKSTKQQHKTQASSSRATLPSSAQSSASTPLTNSKCMPPFADSFWQTYGNKLRVFGTAEGLCEVGPWEQEPLTSGSEDQWGAGGVSLDETAEWKPDDSGKDDDEAFAEDMSKVWNTVQRKTKGRRKA
ncbi:CAF1-domain-containing protein [Pseudovirgaria hyperparasitica]|uniref:CAF1-domain-containing protein n=1 Tax=Pseudovirgaria hyperparasitica TaxID=470096 RepID=A0A6A6WMH5_9PEZI|nr:CAF1-domain-containing protein [Pseudovirgaria hyperparasitica]KAF2763420.1 CAF1-domain-containing protein [Pseudovirgaria hyperparasitica]